MKKLLLSLAIVSFLAFASHAQTTQTTAADNKKETTVKAPETEKASCEKKMSCCHAKGTATTAGSEMKCCKGKDAKACKHEGDKTEGTSSDVKVKPTEDK